MKKTYTTRIELSPDEVADILKKHFGSSAGKVDFTVSDVSDDRMERSPRYDLVKATITIEMDRSVLEARVSQVYDHVHSK